MASGSGRLGGSDSLNAPANDQHVDFRSAHAALTLWRGRGRVLGIRPWMVFVRAVHVATILGCGWIRAAVIRLWVHRIHVEYFNTPPFHSTFEIARMLVGREKLYR